MPFQAQPQLHGHCRGPGDALLGQLAISILKGELHRPHRPVHHSQAAADTSPGDRATEFNGALTPSLDIMTRWSPHSLLRELPVQDYGAGTRRDVFISDSDIRRRAEAAPVLPTATPKSTFCMANEAASSWRGQPWPASQGKHPACLQAWMQGKEGLEGLCSTWCSRSRRTQYLQKKDFGCGRHGGGESKRPFTFTQSSCTLDNRRSPSE